jgi:hypothetical protein
MPRLVYILRRSGDSALRLNSLWAVKNLVRRTSLETKRDIMACLGWDEFVGLVFNHHTSHLLLTPSRITRLLADSDPDIQEQAFTILRNLAENEEGISLVFHHLAAPTSNKSPPSTTVSHPSSPLLSILLSGLTSSSPDVVLQSAYALANLANSPVQAHLEKIAFWPGMLSVLQNLLVDGGVGASAAHTISTHWPPSSSSYASASANPVRTAEIRRPVVGCIAILATKGSSRVRREVRESGISGTLKRLCEWSGVPSGGGASGSHAHGGGVGGNTGLSLSPPTSSSGHWASRTPASPTSGSSSMSGNSASGGVYGSWSGSGSMHGSLGHSAHQGPGVGITVGRYGGHGAYLSGHGHGAGGGVLAIEDDRDVIQRARAALEWLEHGEGFAAGS